MTKKAPHPGEARDAAVIAEAVSWSAFQFRSAHDRQKFECLTRAEAEQAAQAMLDDYPHRPVMIYAINAAGRQALATTISRRPSL